MTVPHHQRDARNCAEGRRLSPKMPAGTSSAEVPTKISYHRNRNPQIIEEEESPRTVKVRALSILPPPVIAPMTNKTGGDNGPDARWRNMHSGGGGGGSDGNRRRSRSYDGPASHSFSGGHRRPSAGRSGTCEVAAPLSPMCCSGPVTTSGGGGRSHDDSPVQYSSYSGGGGDTVASTDNSSMFDALSADLRHVRGQNGDGGSSAGGGSVSTKATLSPPMHEHRRKSKRNLVSGSLKRVRSEAAAGGFSLASSSGDSSDHDRSDGGGHQRHSLATAPSAPLIHFKLRSDFLRASSTSCPPAVQSERPFRDVEDDIDIEIPPSSSPDEMLCGSPGGIAVTSGSILPEPDPALPDEEKGGGGGSFAALGREEIEELRALLPTIRRLHQGATGGGSDNMDGRPSSPRTMMGLFGVGNSGGGNDPEEGGGDKPDAASGRWGDSNGNGGLEYQHLSGDVYSIMFCASHRSHAFFVSMGVFAFQLLILILVLVDIIDPSDDDNPLQIPAGVSKAVRTAQFLAILVAVGTQDDVITSINSIHEGYPGRQMSIVSDSGFGAGKERWQWLLSVACRGVEGTLCLVATFILIVQSRGVVDLFLDFLAVTFVSTLDNIAFSLAQDGYFSRQMKFEAKEVTKVRIPKVRSTNRSRRQAFTSRRIHCRPTMFLIISALLITGWAIIVAKQNNGDYVWCNRIAVQFGDTFAPELAFFSGVYAVSENVQIGGRAVYVETNPGAGRGGSGGSAMFAYCESVGGWTFSFAATPDSTPDPCRWHAMAETDAYDFFSVSPSDWYVLGSESMDAVPFLHFSYECEDCEVETDRGLCSDAGRCVNNRCICDSGRYGRQCEFEAPCFQIEVDTSAEGFRGVQSKKYVALRRGDGRHVMVYGRPVYFGNSTDGAFDLILFTGRRWLHTSTSKFDNNTRMRTLEGAADFLSNDFHGHWTNYTAIYGSAPMDMNTPSDSMSPTRLQWFRTRTFHTKTFKNAVDNNRPVPTLLLCSRCHPDRNPCSNGGDCVDGTCVCPYGSFGALCQVSDFNLCRSLAVQFGDEIMSSLGAYSGVYDIDGNGTIIDGRAVYYERRLRRSAMFAYCEAARAWVVSSPWHPGDNKDDDGGGWDRHCQRNWIVMSSETESYDITEATGWIVLRTEGADEGVPLTYISLRCNDCDNNQRRNDDKRVCSGSGKCSNNRCVCESGRYGLNCELHAPCERIETDSSKPGFPGFPSSQYNTLSFDNGTEVKLYERPVYVARDESEGGSFNIIAFIGRRWILTSSASHAMLGDDPSSEEELAAYMSLSFHGHLSNYTIEFVSEPADVNTLIDTPSPVDLVWHRPKSFDNMRADMNQPVEVTLLCSYCTEVDYVCMNGGECICDGNNCGRGGRGQCSCPFSTFGTLCQVHSLCGELSVQFGPELGPALSSLSGAYLLSGMTLDDRPVYTLRGESNSTTETAVFAYCREENSWVFSDELSEGSGAGEEWATHRPAEWATPCGGRWIAKSSPTHTYDVTTLGSWMRQDFPSGELLPLSFFVLSCADETYRTLLTRT